MLASCSTSKEATMKKVTIRLTPEVSKKLKQYLLDHGGSVQSLLGGYISTLVSTEAIK